MWCEGECRWCIGYWMLAPSPTIRMIEAAPRCTMLLSKVSIEAPDLCVHRNCDVTGFSDVVRLLLGCPGINVNVQDIDGALRAL